MLLSIYKYYSNSLNDASSSVFMTIGGFTKFLKEAGLISVDSNEKLVNYKLEFPFNLTLTAKTKFSNTMQYRKDLFNNKLNTFVNFQNVTNYINRLNIYFLFNSRLNLKNF